MEWQVGQWVRDRDDIGKVERIQGGTIYVKYEKNDFCVAYRGDDLRTFEWQVGKTYKTTRDGTKAIVQGTSVTGKVVGMLSNGVALSWDHKTGLVIGYEQHDGAQHLLPFLADEPSEPEAKAVKPQASSPYDRVIGGVEVDLWTLADIYGITSHRLFSAWKKIAMAGRRGPKDKLRDLREARVGLDKEIAKLEAEGGEQ